MRKRPLNWSDFSPICCMSDITAVSLGRHPNFDWGRLQPQRGEIISVRAFLYLFTFRKCFIRNIHIVRVLQLEEICREKGSAYKQKCSVWSLLPRLLMCPSPLLDDSTREVSHLIPSAAPEILGYQMKMCQASKLGKKWGMLLCVSWKPWKIILINQKVLLQIVLNLIVGLA